MVAMWDANVEKGTYFVDALGLLDQQGHHDKKESLASIGKRYNTCGTGLRRRVPGESQYPVPYQHASVLRCENTGVTFLTVMGGLRTDANLQICEDDDTPIEGLYCVGTMIGDFFAGAYNFGLPGQNLGACCCTLRAFLAAIWPSCKTRAANCVGARARRPLPP